MYQTLSYNSCITSYKWRTSHGPYPVFYCFLSFSSEVIESEDCWFSCSLISSPHTSTLTSIFFTIRNWQIAHSGLLTRHTNYKFMCLSAYWQWKFPNEYTRISAVSKKQINKLWLEYFQLQSDSSRRKESSSNKTESSDKRKRDESAKKEKEKERDKEKQSDKGREKEKVLIFIIITPQGFHLMIGTG